MNKVEAMFMEQMDQEKFQQTITDDFGFVDSLIDPLDLDRINCEEDIA